MSPRVLIIDDEPAIARVLQPVLMATGAIVFSAATAVEGLRMAKENAVQIVLLDLGLPDMDGKELIGDLRALPAAVIVVSARHQETEKVRALDAGADDYVDKPFKIEELLARVRAATRRMAPQSHGVFSSGPLSVDVRRRRVTLVGEEVKLSPKEYDLLRLLVQHVGQVVTHRRLLLAGWGDPSADPQYLRSYMALLRQKIEEDPTEPRIILTEPGVGYRLAALNPWSQPEEERQG
jgi:two-component system, OmpR family, KDP operon response regulator KdpE